MATAMAVEISSPQSSFSSPDFDQGDVTNSLVQLGFVCFAEKCSRRGEACVMLSSKVVFL